MNEIVLGFPPLRQALEKLSSLNEAQFQLLLQEVNGPKGYARSGERLEDLANKLQGKLNSHDIFNILTSLQFFYDSARKWEKAGQDSLEALNEFFDFTGLDE